jgi:glycerol-3-phosphate dehydrogenase
MWQKGWRDRAWAQINKAWDLVVIGGVITGAGVFREAALSGLRVLLLEAGDFTSGTSSRSSKLVHGGLRYLRNGQIKTTFQSVRERHNLLGAGRGLVLPLEFLFIIYERDKIPLGFFGVGLSVYDILGMRWDHRRYKAIDLLKLEPKIDSQGLIGGFRYMDAKVDDARLVLRIIQEGVRAGGLAINYAKVEALLRRNDQSVSGVGFRDMAQDSDGRTYEAAAKAVVNATGASADALRRQVGGRPSLRILKGSHIVFSQRRLPLARAIGFAHPLDRRPVFALPWEGVTVFGTTDLDYPAGDRREPTLSPDEVEYLLSAIRSIFPEVELNKEDVQAGFSGVRAVLDTGQNDPSKEPRDHAIWDEKGLVTVAGGKLTTFRIIAQDVLRIVWKRFPSRNDFQASIESKRDAG